MSSGAPSFTVLADEVDDRLRVVSAALRVGGTIFSVPQPARHHNIISALNCLRVPMDVTQGAEQGFLLSNGKFATRRQAFRVAALAGQELLRKPGSYSGPELYSEDLW